MDKIDDDRGLTLSHLCSTFRRQVAFAQISFSEYVLSRNQLFQAVADRQREYPWDLDHRVQLFRFALLAALNRCRRLLQLLGKEGLSPPTPDDIQKLLADVYDLRNADEHIEDVIENAPKTKLEIKRIAKNTSTAEFEAENGSETIIVETDMTSDYGEMLGGSISLTEINSLLKELDSVATNAEYTLIKIRMM
ncbi:hypothetical protein [Sinorhizobium meliloti]|uniref:hypothetical protein n=1 Tax=Rhizobium meliloti TaxID=382 RepID=UPI000FDBA67F|nr:hypothetical protein [Sinorhizobium meliloti]RVQ20102.1 hypothetical protein CN096_07385 [Sinorhizobium meliloti]